MNKGTNPPSLLKSFFFLLFFLLLTAWIFYLPYKMVRQSTIDSLNTQQSLLARQAAHGIEELFKTYEGLLGHLIKHDTVINLNDEGRKLLDEFFHANMETISAITRIDSSGHIVFTAPYQEDAVGQDVSWQPHNQLIMATQETVVSSVFQAVQGYETVALAVPVFDHGEYAGCLSIWIPFALVAENYLAKMVIGENGYAWMMNHDGVELYCPVPGHTGRSVYETSSKFPAVIKMAEFMMAGMEGETTYTSDRLKGKRGETILKHAVYHPVVLPHNLWSIVVATPEKQALRAVVSFGRWWIVIFAGFVTILLLYASSLIRTRLRFENHQKRQETEAKLAESQRLFSKFINDAHVPIAMVNINDATIEFLNEKCVELYGYTLTDIPTMKDWFSKVYSGEDLQDIVLKRWEQHLEGAKKKTSTIPGEERSIVCKDGSVKEVEFAYTLIEDRMVITLNDKTEQRRLEREKKELEKKKAKTKKMEAIGLMAGGVAHDLNNILSGIVSYPELILMQLPEKSELRHSITLVQESGKQAAAVVADLLTVARSVASVKKTENLNVLIREYMKSPECQSIAFFHHHVTCCKELTADHANIFCSAVHVKKSLMNLLTNGAEAIDQQGQLFIATRNDFLTPELAEEHGLEAGEYVVLSVRDSGAGIAGKDIGHIFEPFYTKKQMGRSGTGLGLAVVWNTMQDHDGMVTVTSTEQGTTFELYFPVSNEELKGHEETVDAEDLMGHGEKILVVDDQAQQRDIARRFLAHFSYQCHTVASGEEALDYLGRNEVDLVVLDMVMGSGMDGCQTYAAVVEKNPGQKAIIASGFSENENVKEVQRLGAGELIKKPYTMAELGTAVKNALAVEV
ncbi:MAG: response regulator [Thermodesulfobacteriota bacterium]